MTELWQHQLQALEYLDRGEPYGLLRHGVATGKTRTTLEFIQRRDFQHVLVVGTKNSIDTWDRQSREHQYNFPTKIYKEGLVRERAFNVRNDFNDCQLQVMNYEAFSKKVMMERLIKLPYDLIVFDEVHRLRGQSTRQSKAAFQIARSGKAFRLGLTGTLFYNHPLDVFGIMRFIDYRIFGFKWTEFKNHYALWTGQYNQIPYDYINLAELKNKIHAVWHNVDRRLVLDLPPEQHLIREVEFTPREYKEYKEFDKEFVLAGNEYRRKAIPATNILDKVLKLQQLTGGFIYNKDTTQHFSNAKEDALTELLEDIDEPTVVFYKFKAERERIKRVTESTGHDFFFIDGSGSTYAEWLLSDKPSVIAVQISSGAEGIDLTKASITIFYSLTYSYGQYEQALGRTNRPNQKATNVLYYYLIVKNSIDERIYRALHSKKDLIEDLVS